MSIETNSFSNYSTPEAEVRKTRRRTPATSTYEIMEKRIEVIDLTLDSDDDEDERIEVSAKRPRIEQVDSQDSSRPVQVKKENVPPSPKPNQSPLEIRKSAPSQIQQTCTVASIPPTNLVSNKDATPQQPTPQQEQRSSVPKKDAPPPPQQHHVQRPSSEDEAASSLAKSNLTRVSVISGPISSNAKEKLCQTPVQTSGLPSQTPNHPCSGTTSASIMSNSTTEIAPAPHPVSSRTNSESTDSCSDKAPILELQNGVPEQIPNAQSTKPPVLVPQVPISTTEGEKLSVLTDSNLGNAPVANSKPALRPARIAHNRVETFDHTHLEKSLYRTKKMLAIFDRPQPRNKEGREQDTPNSAPNKKTRGRKQSVNNKTPEQNTLLEAKFQETSHLSPADVLELQFSTGLSTAQIKQWFNMRRKRSQNESSELDSGFISELETRASTSESGNRIDDDVPNNQRPAVRKYLKSPTNRTSDIKVIREDWKNLENCPAATFNKILTTMWNVKAHRIYSIAKDNSYDMKSTLNKEARRLKYICKETPLSDEQNTMIDEWKEDFLQELLEDNDIGRETEEENKHILSECISPWLLPFMYSKTTTQGERYLTLEIALHDLAKLFMNGSDYSWKTPMYLQYDSKLK